MIVKGVVVLTTRRYSPLSNQCSPGELDSCYKSTQGDKSLQISERIGKRLSPTCISTRYLAAIAEGSPPMMTYYKLSSPATSNSDTQSHPIPPSVLPSSPKTGNFFPESACKIDTASAVGLTWTTTCLTV